MTATAHAVESPVEDAPVDEAPMEEQTVLLAPGEHARAVAAPPPGECLTGSTIGSYRVKELIGRGNFGEVYRAVDPRLGRDVAIKVASGRIADDDTELREICWNEARVQARLEHANIIPIYDLLEESGRLVIVMRLVRGEDLDKRLAKMVRPFTLPETMHLLRQTASAVGAAHEMGVIHQDLKPSNIRLTPNADAVVLDFGIARMAGARADRVATAGTPAYMSPEQINGDPVDARSDIYALALTLYKTLTGHHPFEAARTLDELLAWQCQRPPESPASFNPHLPAAVADVILQGLEKEPRKRFRACSDFALAMAAALGAEADGTTADHNARWDPRARVNLKARLRVPGDEVMKARVVDLSTSGAALLMREPLKVDTYASIVMRIPLKGSSHLVRCAMRVKRVSRSAESGGFLVGITFHSLGNFDRAVIGDYVRAALIHHGER